MGHQYNNFSKFHVDTLMQKLADSGYSIEGNNPWNIDAHTHGVTLQGAWDEGAQLLNVEITGKDWQVKLAGDGKVWEQIDPRIQAVQQLEPPPVAPAGPAAVARGTASRGVIERASANLAPNVTLETVLGKVIGPAKLAQKSGASAVTATGTDSGSSNTNWYVLGGIAAVAGLWYVWKKR